MTLPAGWVETAIGEVVEPIETDNPTKRPDHHFRYVDIGSIDNRSFQITAPKEIVGRDAPSRARRKIKADDVLFSTVRPNLKNIAQVPEHLDGEFTSTGICVLRGTDAIEPGYLFRRVISQDFIDEMTHASDGTMYPAIADGDIFGATIALPPMAEQRRIVAKLDALTARLARARIELARVPALAERLRKAAISVVANAGAARVVPFSEVLDYKGGSQPPKSTFHPEGKPGRIRLLQIRDFASDSKAVFIDDNGKWPRCEADDIMIGRYGASVGKLLSGKAGAYNVALVKMLFDRQLIDAKFLFQWLQGETFQGRLREISRSAQDGFNKEDLADLPFPLLPLAEQTKIARQVDQLIARVDRLEAEAGRAATLLDRLEAAILAKAFKGELVPQDPTDEPAATMLARIRQSREAAPKPKRGRQTKAQA